MRAGVRVAPLPPVLVLAGLAVLVGLAFLVLLARGSPVGAVRVLRERPE